MSRLAATLVAQAAGHADGAAVALLEEPDPGRAAHRARRAIKRARSLLRALKRLDRATAARLNAALRGYAHALAPAREAAAIAEAARMVGLGVAPATPGRHDARLIARGLTETGRAIAAIPAAAGGGLISKALAACYAKARRAYRDYRAEPRGEPLHDARKRAKDLLHLLEALREAGVVAKTPKPRRIDCYAEILGEIRDLDIVTARLPKAAADAFKRRRLAARRQRLARDAAREGDRAFDSRPRKIAKVWRKAVKAV